MTSNVFAPETAEYFRALGRASDEIQQRYQLDDMGQATPAMLDELDALVANIERQFGVTT